MEKIFYYIWVLTIFLTTLLCVFITKPRSNKPSFAELNKLVYVEMVLIVISILFLLTDWSFREDVYNVILFVITYLGITVIIWKAMLVKNVAVRYLLFVVGGIPLVIGMLLVVSVFGLSFIIQGSLPVKTHNILKNVSIAVFWKYNQNTSIIEVYRHYSFFPFVKQKVYSKKYRFNKFGYKEVIGLNVLFEKDSNCIVISDDEASIDTIPIMDIIK